MSASSSESSSQQWPLRLILVAPFIVQLLVVEGITIGLSYWNGRQTVRDLVGQLQTEISNRIHQELDMYMGTPNLVNQVNQSALEVGHLDLDQVRDWLPHFWRQIQIFDGTAYLSAGTETAEFVGVMNERTDLLSFTSRMRLRTALLFSIAWMIRDGPRLIWSKLIIMILGNGDGTRQSWKLANQHGPRFILIWLLPLWGSLSDSPILMQRGHYKG